MRAENRAVGFQKPPDLLTAYVDKQGYNTYYISFILR